MWYYATGTTAALVAAGGWTYARTRRTDEDSLAATARRLEDVRRVEDVVRMLRRLARRAPTEDVVAHLSEALADYGISEAALQRLSTLHRTHGADDGAYGYAMSMVWSTVLDGVAHRGVLIHVD